MFADELRPRSCDRAGRWGAVPPESDAQKSGRLPLRNALGALHAAQNRYAGPGVAKKDDCLTEDSVARLLEGQLAGEALASAERHLAQCDECMELVGAVGDLISPTISAAAHAAHSAHAAPDSEPAGGETVGRYRILAPLGAGAMGRVLLAYDPSLDRKVALKLLHARAATPELESRLLREAKAMAKLSHPEVITVHDAGRHGEQLFIAMELVDGGTLREWLASGRRTWREILDVYLRAGRGLAWANDAGIVHRDFKPDNVLIGKDGRVRVTDFGLARSVEVDPSPPTRRQGAPEGEPADEHPDSPALELALTRTGTLLGTPMYMAPEQLAGRPADARADVYAFCVSLYEALYGERPFEARSLSALLRKKLEGDVAPPKSGSEVPRRLRRALLVGLSPRLDDRYPSMDALLVALRAAVATRKLPWVAGILGLTALVVFGSVAGRAEWNRRARRDGVTTVSSSSGAKVGCSRAACVAESGGLPAVCRPDGTCATIASADCTPRSSPDDLRDEGTVWLGAMFPTQGPGAEAFGAMSVEGVDFAREEIARATSGIVGAGASPHVRRIALAICDDSQDPMRAAHHLVDDIGVPAILGFGSGKEIEDVAGKLLIDRHVLTMASLTSSPLVTRIPQPAGLPRMVWRTSYSIEAVAEATAAFLRDALETPAQRVAGTTHITVARADTGLGVWFGEALFRKLSFNGKSAEENGAKYQELTFASPSSDDEVGKLAERIARTSPSIAVLLGASSDTSRIVAAVEARGAHPRWVLASDTTDIVAPFIGKSAERRHRIFGVVSVTRTPEARFVIRFNAAHARQVTRSINPGMSYDALYVLAYATFALGDQAVDGPSLAGAIERLIPPGRRVESGPTDLFDALTELSQGKHVDLDGPSGSLDFNPKTGESASDFALLCPALDAQGAASHDVESGVVFRAGAKGAEGKMKCP